MSLNLSLLIYLFELLTASKFNNKILRFDHPSIALWDTFTLHSGVYVTHNILLLVELELFISGLIRMPWGRFIFLTASPSCSVMLRLPTVGRALAGAAKGSLAPSNTGMTCVCACVCLCVCTCTVNVFVHLCVKVTDNSYCILFDYSTLILKFPFWLGSLYLGWNHVENSNIFFF